MGSPLWGSTESNKTSWFFIVKQQQIRIKQMNIYLTKGIEKQNPIKGWKEQIHQQGGNIYIFHSFETLKSSILKQLEIKIVGSHSRFQKLQKDKQKTHLYLKLCSYEDCWIS